MSKVHYDTPVRGTYIVRNIAGALIIDLRSRLFGGTSVRRYFPVDDDAVHWGVAAVLKNFMAALVPCSKDRKKVAAMVQESGNALRLAGNQF